MYHKQRRIFTICPLFELNIFGVFVKYLASKEWCIFIELAIGALCFTLSDNAVIFSWHYLWSAVQCADCRHFRQGTIFFHESFIQNQPWWPQFSTYIVANITIGFVSKTPFQTYLWHAHSQWHSPHNSPSNIRFTGLELVLHSTGSGGSYSLTEGMVSPKGIPDLNFEIIILLQLRVLISL